MLLCHSLNLYSSGSQVSISNPVMPNLTSRIAPRLLHPIPTTIAHKHIRVIAMLLPNLRDSLLKLADAACLVGLDCVDTFNELNQNRVVLCQRIGKTCQKKLSHSPDVVAHCYCHGDWCPQVFDCLCVHSSPQRTTTLQQESLLLLLALQQVLLVPPRQVLLELLLVL